MNIASPVYMYICYMGTPTISFFIPVLADLPIPSHYSTSLEQTVAGRTPLTAESMKVVNSNDIALSMQIASALTAVDCSFL